MMKIDDSMSRRLIITLVAPVVLSLIILWAERAGLFNSNLAMVLLVMMIAAAQGIALWMNARRVNLMDVQRQQAEERFRIAVEAAPNAIIMVEESGVIVLVNPQVEKFFGYTRNELLGKSVEQLVPERFQEVHALHRAGFYANPQTRAMGAGRELYGLRKDGSEFPVEIGLASVRTPEGILVLASIVDITERKQARERFRLVVESAPNAIVLVEQGGKIAMANLQAEKFFGYERMELIGKEVDYLVPERFRKHHSSYRDGFLAEPQIRPMGIGRDLYGLRKDGSEFPIEIGLTPIETKDGLLVLASIVDITERKQAEQALRLNEQRFRALTENSWDSVALFGADGAILYGSPSTRQILGYELDEFVGRNAFELIHKDDQTFVTERLTISLQKPGQHVSVHARVLHKDGSWRWLEGTFTNLLGEPSVQAIVNNYHDFTERKQAEEQMSYQSHLLANVSDAIVASDENYILKAWNAAAERMYGWQAEEVIGRNGSHILQTEFPGAESAEMRRQIAERGHYFGEATQLRKDGTRISVEVASMVLYDDSGQTTGYVSVNRDITERKRVEQALARSEREFRALAENALVGIFRTHVNGEMLFVNDSLAQMLEFESPEELMQQTAIVRYKNPADRAALFNKLKEQQGRVNNYELQILTKYDRVRDMLISATFDGQILSGTVIDITERKQAEERYTFLASASKALSSSLDYEITLATVAQLAVPKIADWCTVYLKKTNGEIEQVALTHANPEKVKWARELQKRYPPNPNSSRGVAQVIHLGKPEFMPEIPAELLEPLKEDPETAALLDELQLTGAMTVPILFHDRILGAISLISAESRLHYTLQDLDLAEELARRVAVAIENARLFKQVQDELAERERAEDKLEQQNQRLKVLREIDAAILAAESVESIVNAALKHIRELIDCRRAHMTIFDWGTNEAVIFNISASNASFIPTGTHIPLAGMQDMVQTLSQKQLMLIDDLTALPNPPALFQSVIREGFRSVCVLPLFSQGKLIGTFNLSSETPGFFDEEKIGLGREVANQVAIATTQSNLLKELRTLNMNLEQRVQERTLQLQATNKELETFAYSVSHDLRAPLRHINGFSQALSNRHADVLGEEAKHYLRRIEENTRHMGQLIDDLLALSRISRREMKQDLVNLTQLAREVDAELRGQEAGRQVQFEVEDGLEGRGDAGLIRIVLQNLLSNAWKFTSTRPQAQIQFGLAQSSNSPPPLERIYFVRDNGVGFDMAYANKLFGAFQRLHSIAEFPGTGIGLATVQRIIHRHGGRVWAESEQGIGTTFYFTLGGKHET